MWRRARKRATPQAAKITNQQDNKSNREDTLSKEARLWLALAATTLFAASALAQQEVPAKTLPVPADVSPQIQKIIAMPLRNGWNVLPKTGEEWKPIADAGAEPTIKALPGLLERMKVKVEKSTIDGVRVFIVTPAT